MAKGKSNAGSQTIESGPWRRVWNSTDAADAYQDSLYAASNCYRLKGKASAFAMRPPFWVTKAAGTLGSASSRKGQGFQQVTGSDGTTYDFVFVGGKMYGVTGVTTYTDITPATVTLPTSGLISTAAFGGKLIVGGGSVSGVSGPWTYEPSTATATHIDYDGAGSDWSIRGQPVVYAAKLFFIVNNIDGQSYPTRIAWSEELSPATGYKQTDFDNEWDLAQTDQSFIRALAATNSGLYYLRRRSIGLIAGAVNAEFQTTATHDAVSEEIGTFNSSSVLVARDHIWFRDEFDRPWRIPFGGKPEPLWGAMADTIAVMAQAGMLSSGSTGSVANLGGCAYLHDLDVIVQPCWRSTVSTEGFNVLYVFDADSGDFLGNWDIDGGRHAHLIASSDRPQLLGPTLVILGDTSTGAGATATSGQAWALRVLAEMSGSTAWADPTGETYSKVVTHHLGRSDDGEWTFSEATLRAIQFNDANRSMRLTYYTPRLASASITATLSQPQVAPVIPGTSDTTGYFGEARALWGLGPNAQGRWLMAELSGPSDSSNMQPFAPVAFSLKGRLRKAGVTAA